MDSLNNNNYYYATAAAAFGVLLLVEHFLKEKHVDRRPSYFLYQVSKVVRRFFRGIGEQLAKWSSFLIHIERFARRLIDFIRDLSYTFMELAIPIMKIVLSPLLIAKGYVLQACSYRGKALLIPLGSGLTCYALYLLHQYLPYPCVRESLMDWGLTAFRGANSYSWGTVVCSCIIVGIVYYIFAHNWVGTRRRGRKALSCERRRECE